MAETKKKTWIEVYVANYEGKTPEAQSIKDYLKENYKGNSYVPWATMERLVYMQDSDAKFEKLMTENGELVWTSTNNTSQEVIADGVVKQSTSAKMFGHFVKVKLTFMGKEFIEDYPIQDSSYEAVKAYDSNLINKALQRALAKVASRATGIGLKLYENKDLQFDEDTSKPKKPEIKKTQLKTQPLKVEVAEVDDEKNKPKSAKEMLEEVKKDEPLIEAAKEVVEPTGMEKVLQEDMEYMELESVTDENLAKLVKLIKETDKDKITSVLQKLNPAILNKFKFVLSADDSETELVEKVSKFEDVSKFIRAIEIQLNSL